MTVMTEKARTYAIVLYELGIPGQMVEGAVSIFKESPQLVRTLKSPVVPVIVPWERGNHGGGTSLCDHAGCGPDCRNEAVPMQDIP